MAPIGITIARKLRAKQPIVREALAEFLGTFILITFGNGSVAQYVYGKTEGYSSYLVVNLAWGLAVTMGVHVAGGVSGAHINPAVSLAFSVIGKLAWWKLPVYILSQYVGAIVASGVVYGVYYDAQKAFEANFTTPGTASIYSTFPKDYLSTGNGFGDQVCGTGLLVLCILAITDERNMPATKGMAPLLIGLIVTVIGMSFGLNCGYAINPARDLGPRIFTAMAGWGTDPFTFRNHNWFWVPVIGPHLGGILGAFVYLLFIGIHLEDTEEYELNTPEEAIEFRGTQNAAFQEGDSATASDKARF